MAQELRFALTDNNGQLTGTPKAQVDSIAQSKADAVKALIPDVSALATKTEISTLATKAEIPVITNLATKSELTAKADVTAVDSKIATAKSQILAQVGTGGGAATSTPRYVPLALTLGQITSAAQYYTNTDDAVRFPLQFNAAISKWRVHIQNVNPMYGTVKTGAINMTGIAFGAHDPANPGKYLGAPTKIQDAFTTPADGSEWVSPWFTQNIGDNKQNLLEIAFTGAPASGVIGLAGGAYTAGKTAFMNTTTAPWSVNTSPFFVWIEAETPSTTPVYTFFGDSLTVGIGSNLPVFHSVASQYARKNGGLPIHYAASGDTMKSWIDGGETSLKISQWDSLTKGDVLVHSMASNDIFSLSGTGDLQTVKDRFNTSLAMMKKRVKSGADVFATTIFPRDKITGGQEDLRRAYNAWLATLDDAGTLKRVFEWVSVISNDDETIMSGLGSVGSTPDGIHLNQTAYGKLADYLSLPVSVTAAGAGIAITDNGNGTATITL